MYMIQIVIRKNQLLVLNTTGQNSKSCALIFRCVTLRSLSLYVIFSVHGHDRFQEINEVIGLKDIILDGNKFSSQTTGCYFFIKVF